MGMPGHPPPPPPPPPHCGPPPPPPHCGPPPEAGMCGEEGSPHHGWGRHGPWRRMMKRWMRRMMYADPARNPWEWREGAAAAAAEANPSTPESGATSRDSSMDSQRTQEAEGKENTSENKQQQAHNPHEDYLRGMGEQVAELLDPLGELCYNNT